MPIPGNVANLPVIGPWLTMKDQNQNVIPGKQLGQMAQFQTIQNSMQEQQMRQQKMQEQQQIKGLVAQHGGDLPKTIQALLQSGTPQGIELASKLHSLIPKPQGRTVVTPGSTVLGPDNKPLFTAPERPEKPTDKWSDPYPMNGAMVQRNESNGQIRTAVSREQPGVTISMPASSDTVQGEDNRFYKFRIGKDGKREIVPMESSEGMPLRPLESPSAKRIEEQTRAEGATLESVKQRVQSMSDLIQGGAIAGGVVGPRGFASRLGETAAGVVDPSVNTPAINYQNDMRLLLSDVRKMVEKDPNLSKDEREAMYETLGGGIMQTDGSALRALNNIIQHVESKQRPGQQSRGQRLVAPPVGQREAGKQYQTPKGIMTWTGTGWLPAN